MIGFDSTEIEVIKRPTPQHLPVCLEIAEEPARTGDTYLVVNTHSGLAGTEATIGLHACKHLLVFTPTRY